LEFPYPLLVCDIGGTNVRMAAVEDAAAQPEFLPRLKTADFPGFHECVEHVLGQRCAERPRSILACGARPVAHRRLHLTNASCTIDGPQTAYRLGLSQGILFNDFEAQALALPAHRPEWLHAIGPDLPREPGPQIILGPGTGLGVAALVRNGDKFLPLASEAAHMELGPATPEDQTVWPLLERFHGRITAETVISGPGIARLHRARLAAAGEADAAGHQTEIVGRALADPHGREADTIRHFWRLTGRFAGDMALVFLARCGVTLSGGILPRIRDLLDPTAFRAAFEDKAPMTHLLVGIPTSLVTAPDAVLAGMAAIAAHPERYQIDYRERAWR